MQATIGKARVRWHIAKGDERFIRLTPVPVAADPETPPPAPKRLRRVSVTGTGRGTGRGGKAPAKRLTRPLKPHGKRSEFIRFIGSREVSVVSVRNEFDMSHANVNGFLTNINRDHGIGYEKEGGQLRLVLPPGCNWQNVWGT
jgi:hypothetical protein